MADSRNDIVINAAAETKGAEKNIEALDNKVKGLSKSAPGLDKLSRSMDNAGLTAAKAGNNANAMSASFAALQGSVNGVITKLGALGLAIGVLKLAWDTAQKEHQRYFDAMNAQAETSQKTFTTLNDSTKNILDNLQKLDQLADGGYLDDAAIKQTNSLVAQLNDLWGDVGLSVDKATGKVTGLKDVTDKLTAELRKMQLDQVKLEEQVAQAEYDEAQNNYSWWYDENGRLHNEAMGMLIAGNWVGTGDNYKSELDNARKAAQAKLIGIQQRRKQLEGYTTASDVAASISAAEQRQKDDAAAQAAAIAAQEQAQTEFENRLEKAQAKLKGIDAEEERLFTLPNTLYLAEYILVDVFGHNIVVTAKGRTQD